MAVGSLPQDWPAEAPNPWAMGTCGLAGCWCSEEAHEAIRFAAARLLASVRALVAEQDPEEFPHSAAAAKSLLRATAALYREASS
jgi:hypothetical protein